MDSNHLRNRWEYFSWVGFKGVNADGSLSEQQAVESGVSGFKYSDALNEIEGILIEIIEPKLNKQGGKLSAAREYRQFIDEKFREITNSDLRDEIRAMRKLLSGA